MKRIKINNVLIEKHKDMLENFDSEQNLSSIISSGIYKVGHHSIRLMKWLA